MVTCLVCLIVLLVGMLASQAVVFDAHPFHATERLQELKSGSARWAGGTDIQPDSFDCLVTPGHRLQGVGDPTDVAFADRPFR